jgi:hypothetical protein
MHSAEQQEAWELVEGMDDRQLKSEVLDLRSEVLTLKVEIADDAIALRDMMRERDAAEAALATEREKVRVLRSALENLCDEQNGAPLETHRDQWQLAMDEARLALVVTEESK